LFINCGISHIFFIGMVKVWHFQGVLCATCVQYLTICCIILYKLYISAEF
jgi:hypothetical protein